MNHKFRAIKKFEDWKKKPKAKKAKTKEELIEIRKKMVKTRGMKESKSDNEPEKFEI